MASAANTTTTSKAKTLLSCLLATCLLALAAGMFEPEVALADRTVYVSQTGKYHFNSGCSGMKHYTAMSHSAADAAGYAPCKKCASAYSGGNSASTTRSAIKAGWKSNASGWWYQNSNGGYPKNAWKKISGAWYYFDGAGYMQTGWTSVGGKWYYLGTNGKMVTGWKKISGKWYYFAGSGAMKTGWLKSGKTWYYLDDSGVMQTGWLNLAGKMYYLNGKGAMVTGWQKISNKWYYFAKSGVMQVNKWVGNYYLQNDGTMATNTWIDKYHVNKNGKWDKTGYSEQDLCSLALKYYQKNAGYTAANMRAKLDHKTGNEYAIQVYEDHSTHTATLNWYYVDASGSGKDIFGQNVKLAD